MSLKGGNPRPTLRDHTKITAAIEGYKNGDKDALKRLYEFVEKGLLSNEGYANIIQEYEPMYRANKEKRDAEKPRIRKKAVYIILCVVLLLSLIASAVIYHLYAIDSTYANGYDIGKTRGYSEGYDKGFDKGYGQYKEIKDEYRFFHKNAVIATTSGSKYHRYGCYHIKNRRFYIFNISNAKAQGYTPCRDCFD